MTQQIQQERDQGPTGLGQRWKTLPRKARWATLAGVAVALYMLGGFVVLPRVLEAVLPTRASKALGRTVTLERASFNPLTHELAMEGLAMAEAEGSEPFVSVNRIAINASPFSLLRLAVLVDEVRLTRPRVRVIHLDDGQFNFSDILERLAGSDQAREEAEQAITPGPFPLVVNNFIIEDGALTFEDRPKETTHTVEALNLTIPFASTLPGDAQQDVEPRLRAIINGTVINATGRSRPFDDTLRTEFDLRLDGLDLTQYATYAPLPPGVQLASGQATLALALAFERSEGLLPQLVLQGKVRLADMALAWADGRELAGFSSLAVDLERFSLQEGLVRTSLIALDGPYGALVRNSDGTLDWLALFPSKASGETKADDNPNGESPGFVVQATRIEITGGRLALRDNAAQGGFTKTVTPIDLSLNDLNTAGGPASYALSLGPADGEHLALSGSADLAPLSVNGTLALSGLALRPYAPYYEEALPLRLDSGTLHTAADFDVALDTDGEAQLRVNGLSATLGQLALALPGAKAPALTLGTLDVAGGALDLGARTASVDAVTLSEGKLSITRRDSGDIDLLAAFASEAQAPAPARASETAAPWRASLGSLALKGWTIGLSDSALKTPNTSTLAIHDFTARNLSAAMNQTIGYALAATLGAKGGILVKGYLMPAKGDAPLRTKGSLTLSHLALADFSPYVAELAGLTLNRGTLALSGHFDTTLGPDDAGNLDTTFNGEFGLAGVAVEAQGQPLAALESFAAKGLALQAMPLSATMEDISLAGLAVRDPGRPQDAASIGSFTLSNARLDLAGRSLTVSSAELHQPEAHVVIGPDGIVNLARIIARATGAPQPEPKAQAPEDADKTQDIPAQAEPAQAATTPEETPGFALALDSFTLEGGAVRFVDESLSPAFSSALENLDVRLTGFSTRPGAQAILAANATVDGHAPFIVQGQASPTDIGLNPDIRLSLNGLDLTHLSPYSLKFIAFPVTAGKLFADLRLSVDKRDVLGENRLRLARFDLGSKQAVEGAINAPVKLAVALLRDGNGDILLDVPIRGNLDDPQFRLGKVIFRAVMNLLVKAVTSPFALIGSLFGGGAQDLDTLAMPLGNAALSDKALGKLATVTKALSERPGLRLEIHGATVPDDLPALAELRFQRAVKTTRFNELRDEGTAPQTVEEVQLTPEEFLEYLTEVYEDAPFEKPENVFGFPSDQPQDIMERMLREHLAPAAEDLATLAQDRARLTRDQLLANGVAQGRIFIVETPEDATSEGTSGVRLLLQ